ncbi:MAG: DUF3298 domain-containing protein [Chitinophagales bacterium]
MEGRRYFTIFLFFVTNSIYSQQSWYKSYHGFIDTCPVTMHLNKATHDYFGYYFYDLYQDPIYFTGEDTSEKGAIKLTSFLPDQTISESFFFQVKDSSITGKWYTNSSKALSFSAKQRRSLLSFDFISTHGTIKLRPKMTGSPGATYEAASVWPKGNSIQEIFLKKSFNEMFGIKNSTDDIGKVFLQQKKQYFDGYIKTNKNLKNEEIRDNETYDYDQSDQIMVVFQSSALLTLAKFSSSYTGGAHGNYGTLFTSVDLVNNKKLRLDDVITIGGQMQLSKLLEKYFRKTYSLKDTDSLTEGGLFGNQIEPNNNFYVTAKGIGFNYLPYEIGPFAMGEINIFIPFSELNNYLQPSFRKIID